MRVLNSIFLCYLVILPSNCVVSSESIPIREVGGFQKHTKEKIRLGELLFFDKILSGNKNISCASCHNPLTNTADGLSLGIGEGGTGLGQARVVNDLDSSILLPDKQRSKNKYIKGLKKRIPRNTPALFNLGHKDFFRLFHDGRVESSFEAPSGFVTPTTGITPLGLESPLAAQALFPLTSADEMAGRRGTNSVADAAYAKRFDGPGGVWDILVKRVELISEYERLFLEAFPRDPKVSIVNIVNAIGAYESHAWRADQSPYDHYLAGNSDSMSPAALKGLELFKGKGQCSRCHSGRWQSDHDFHSIAMPQIGPGKGDGIDGNNEYGRERVTGEINDRFKFRTPSLRNVTLTAPYGHCGAYPDLKSTIKHHLDPKIGLETFNPAWIRFNDEIALNFGDLLLFNNIQERRTFLKFSEIQKINLSDAEIDIIIHFLEALTDPKSMNMVNRFPDKVPSGLPISD